VLCVCVCVCVSARALWSASVLLEGKVVCIYSLEFARQFVEFQDARYKMPFVELHSADICDTHTLYKYV
jgi:hypothetical protein